MRSRKEIEKVLWEYDFDQVALIAQGLVIGIPYGIREKVINLILAHDDKNIVQVIEEQFGWPEDI